MVGPSWPKPDDLPVPEGAWRLDVHEAWIDGDELIVLGDPGGEEDLEEESHNCDAMGCSSLGWHVLARGKITICGPPPKE